ncbi:MAG: acetyltransferase [Clostridiales Family XIII bacterium]|jgi:sugar O-acyltransferase (sialic acid O-acetyltransferase NeuD family)|nr:acetyltransferase [Clostridiales Family XIII bacterium]
MTDILCIYGCGGLGKEVLDTYNGLPSAGEAAFVDDGPAAGQNILGTPVYAYEHILQLHRAGRRRPVFVVGLGEPRIRARLYEKILSDGFACANVVGRSAEISPFASVEPGVVIQPQCIVPHGAVIGFGCFLNYQVVTGHDTSIGRCCVLSPKANLGGNVQIGENCYVGSSAVIRNDVKIGKNVIIGMGAVVLDDVPDDAVMVGNPARMLRKNKDGVVFG